MKTKLLLTAVLATVWMSPASAIEITFDEDGGVGNGAFIDEFYNGGFDSQGNSGPDVGVQFGGTATGLNSPEFTLSELNSTESSSGNRIVFTGEPSPDTVMYYARNPSGATRAGFGLVNFAQGFINSISFYFSQSAATSTVQVFSGLNGSGTELASVTLMENWQDGGCSSSSVSEGVAALSGGGSDNTYCNWDVENLPFAGVAQSIIFSGAAGKVLFDNLTLEPVPLPAAVWLLGSGLLGFAAIRRRRQAV